MQDRALTNFQVALEMLWKEEIIVDCCEKCKKQKQCYSPFLTMEIIEAKKQIDKIRNCKKRTSLLKF